MPLHRKTPNQFDWHPEKRKKQIGEHILHRGTTPAIKITEAQYNLLEHSPRNPLPEILEKKSVERPAGPRMGTKVTREVIFRDRRDEPHVSASTRPITPKHLTEEHPTPKGEDPKKSRELVGAGKK